MTGFVNVNKIKRKIWEGITYIISCIRDLFYLKKVFYFVFFSFVIIYICLLIVNFCYIDDVIRIATNGGLQFKEEGGWIFADIIMRLFSAGNILFDTSPIRQIVFLFFISLSSILLLYLFCDVKEPNIFCIISSMILGLTMPALVMISHKYDSAHYGICIFLSLSPFIFYDKGNIYYLIFSIVFTSLSFLTYHAMSGIYPVVVIFLTLRMFSTNEAISKIIKFVFVSLLSYVSSLVFYCFNILLFGMAKDRMLDSFSYNIFSNLFMSFTRISFYLKIDHINRTTVFIIVVLIVYISIYVIESKRSKIMSIIAIIFSLIFISIIQFGYTPFSSLMARGHSNINTYLYGYSITISIILIWCTSSKIKFNYSYIISIIAVVYFVLSVFAYEYVLLIQGKNNANFASKIAKDISDMNLINHNKAITLYINGVRESDPEVKNICNTFNKISNNILNGFSMSWPFPLYIYYYFDNNQIKIADNIYLDKINDKEILDRLSVYVECGQYRILTDYNENILVEINSMENNVS